MIRQLTDTCQKGNSCICLFDDSDIYRNRRYKHVAPMELYSRLMRFKERNSEKLISRKTPIQPIKSIPKR